jgi:hypothetical protein
VKATVTNKGRTALFMPGRVQIPPGAAFACEITDDLAGVLINNGHLVETTKPRAKPNAKKKASKKKR